MMPFLQTPLYLWGFMGSGKSALGRRLAREWALPFYETDAMVEVRAAETISNIFRDKGEPQFRSYECEVLHSIPTNEPAIVATGGGLPCFEDNAEWMLQHGLTLFLALSTEELAARLERSHTPRPLLREKRGNELRSHIQQMLELREPIYRKAHIAIDANLASPEYLYSILMGYATIKSGLSK